MKRNSAVERAIGVIGSRQALADELGVTVEAVRQWLAGLRPVPPERAAQVEQVVRGRVRAEELCPSVRWNRGPSGELLGYCVALNQGLAA